MKTTAFVIPRRTEDAARLYQRDPAFHMAIRMASDRTPWTDSDLSVADLLGEDGPAEVVVPNVLLGLPE